MLDMQLDGSREHHGFDVTAYGYEVFWVQEVIGALDVLLDDGTFVQIFRHIVRCGTDELHATLVRLMVGLGPLKLGRNEWWMLMARPSSLEHSSFERICM